MCITEIGFIYATDFGRIMCVLSKQVLTCVTTLRRLVCCWGRLYMCCSFRRAFW